jgi:hypothetical protein
MHIKRKYIARLPAQDLQQIGPVNIVSVEGTGQEALPLPETLWALKSCWDRGDIFFNGKASPHISHIPTSNPNYGYLKKKKKKKKKDMKVEGNLSGKKGVSERAQELIGRGWCKYLMCILGIITLIYANTFVCLFVCLFRDRVSLCISGCPGTHSVDLVSL